MNEKETFLTIDLFDHQIESIKNMENLELTRRIRINDEKYMLVDCGILGDIPGYGKSFSILSVMLRDKMEWKVQNIERIEMHNDYIITIKKNIVNKPSNIKTNFLLVSPSIVEQWKEYFSFIKKNRYFSIAEIVTRKDIVDFDILRDYDLVLVSSSRYNEFIDSFGNRNIVWKRFIMDDITSIHIPAMRNIRAGFIWLISSSWKDVRSFKKYGFLKYFFDGVFVSQIENLVIKNDDDFVKQSFRMPDVKEIFHKCNTKILQVVSKYVSEEVRNMISAGDIKSAILKLGCGFTQNNNLIEIVSKKHKEKLQVAKNSLVFWTGRNNCKKEIDMWTNKIKDLESIIDGLEKKYNEMLGGDCSICYCSISIPVMNPCCQNIFCANCILEWHKNKHSCPLCRAEFSIESLIYINEKNIDFNEEKKEVFLQKPDKILEIIKNGPIHSKYIVFSEYDMSFSIIRRIFDDNKMDFVEISGTSSCRNSKIKKFVDGNVNIIFLNSRFNGAGLNLQEATDIIFYHDLDEATRNQNIGRVLRIGRRVPLTIHNLV